LELFVLFEEIFSYLLETHWYGKGRSLRVSRLRRIPKPGILKIKYSKIHDWSNLVAVIGNDFDFKCHFEMFATIYQKMPSSACRSHLDFENYRYDDQQFKIAYDVMSSNEKHHEVNQHCIG
jgi:hypothetical protein